MAACFILIRSQIRSRHCDIAHSIAGLNVQWIFAEFSLNIAQAYRSECTLWMSALNFSRIFVGHRTFVDHSPSGSDQKCSSCSIELIWHIVAAPKCFDFECKCSLRGLMSFRCPRWPFYSFCFSIFDFVHIFSIFTFWTSLSGRPCS